MSLIISRYDSPIIQVIKGSCGESKDFYPENIVLRVDSWPLPCQVGICGGYKSRESCASSPVWLNVSSAESFLTDFPSIASQTDRNM